MIEAIKAAIEAKFQTLAADGRSFVDKVEEIIGLGNAAKELADIEARMTTIVNDSVSTTEQKVEQILNVVGKL